MKLNRNSSDYTCLFFSDLKLIYVSDTLNFADSKKLLLTRYPDFEIIDDSSRKHWNRAAKVISTHNKKIKSIDNDLKILSIEISKLSSTLNQYES